MPTEKEIEDAEFAALFYLTAMDFGQELTPSNILIAIRKGEIPNVKFEINTTKGKK